MLGLFILTISLLGAMYWFVKDGHLWLVPLVVILCFGMADQAHAAPYIHDDRGNTILVIFDDRSYYMPEAETCSEALSKATGWTREHVTSCTSLEWYLEACYVDDKMAAAFYPGTTVAFRRFVGGRWC